MFLFFRKKKKKIGFLLEAHFLLPLGPVVVLVVEELSDWSVLVVVVVDNGVRVPARDVNL